MRVFEVHRHKTVCRKEVKCILYYQHHSWMCIHNVCIIFSWISMHTAFYGVWEYGIFWPFGVSASISESVSKCVNLYVFFVDVVVYLVQYACVKSVSFRLTQYPCLLLIVFSYSRMCPRHDYYGYLAFIGPCFLSWSNTKSRGRSVA